MSLHHQHTCDARQPHSATDSQPAWPDDDQVRRVYQYLYRAVGNREDAEELTERAYTVTLRDLRDMNDGERFERQLFERARALLTERLRAFYRVDTPLALTWTIETDDLLAALEVRDREILTCRFLRGETLGETAERFDISAHDALAAQWSALMRAAQGAATMTASAAAQPSTCDCATP